MKRILLSLVLLTTCVAAFCAQKNIVWEKPLTAFSRITHNVVHYNLPDAQQKSVENFLQINAFPTYKLFDQQGNLLDVNADPRHLDVFENLIKRIITVR